MSAAKHSAKTTPKKAAAVGRRTAVSDSTLRRIAQTSLYEPVNPGAGEKMCFLRWSTKDLPETLELSDTWANTGAPPNPGYLLFFDTVVAAASATAVEKGLRALLAETETTAIAWVTLGITPAKPVLSTLLKTKLDSEQHPVLDGETAVTVERGVETVTFPDATPLTGGYSEGVLQSIATTYPPTPGDQVPDGNGVKLPLIGGASGKLVGCICFLGLVDSLPGGGTPQRRQKSLMQVAFDPLNPFNSARNFQVFTGLNYFLVAEDSGYRLIPAT
jgi:hypothetical protein